MEAHPICGLSADPKRACWRHSTFIAHNKWEKAKP